MLGILPAALLAIPLYHYSIFAMGLPLVAFFAVLLVMGWALGLAICGLILRQGMGAEGLAWTVVFTLSPISCVYYPVSILPGWLQHAAWALPSTYVFEGMRAVLFSGVFETDYLFTALALDILYVGLRRGGLFCLLSQRAPPRRAAADGRVIARRPSRRIMPSARSSKLFPDLADRAGVLARRGLARAWHGRTAPPR